nr:putative late blight resistance protein homolog R1A-3 [Coffea arabica]
MASSSITCISSALDDLQSLLNIFHYPEFLLSVKNWLTFLRTFILCATKWGKDYVHLASDDKEEVDNHHASLEALIVRIEDAISKRAQELHSIYLSSSENPSYNQAFKIVDCIEGSDMVSLRPEIYRWYFFFSDCSSKLSSNLIVRKDDIMEFMDSLLESLEDFHEWGFADGLIKALEEKLEFLKNYIRFVTLHDVEDTQLGPLLTHVKAVAIKAARLSYQCKFVKKSELQDETDKSILELLLKIIPVEPQVHETCVQALIASKLSRKSLGDTDEQILRDFVDSLLCNLADILKSGLAILSPSLNAIKDGVLLSQDMELLSSDLLKKIQLIETTVAQRCPEPSLFDYPKTNGLGFIDFLLENLMELTSTEAGSITFMNHPIQAVQEELVCLRSLLGRIVELRSEDEELQAIRDCAIEVAYKIEFLVDSLMVGDDLDSSSMSFHSIVEEIKIIKAKALQICDNDRLHGKVKKVSKRLFQMPTQLNKPIINDVVVGLEYEAASIINRLTRGSLQLQIVSIVGMPGLGKTTLARKVYNSSSVMSYFYKRAWCTVSQVYHKRNLLLEILSCIESKLPGNVFEISEEVLAHEVKRRLLRNKYLIVLDDVWDIEAVNGLEASFPDNGNGSRVILTSRRQDVAPQDKLDQEPHSLRQLTPDESWDLLKAKLYPGQDLAPPELCEIRQKVVEMCQGLPLTVVILAGILSSMDRHDWKEVVEGLSSRNVSSTEQCTATLELSYKHLPDNLKACFLYFGAFPEDYEHNTKRLISLWVAEGFVQKTQLKRSEDVANDYLMELISRSLVIVSKPRSIDGVKACRIHDLLYEFCVTKAKGEKLLQLVRRYDELSAFTMPCYLRRLCIDSKPEHFDNLRLFSSAIRCLLLFHHGGVDRERSFDLRFIFSIIKLVKVLDLSQIQLRPTFPRELELLVHLRYLAILGDGSPIPASICNLSNLETLIWENFSFHSSVSLPDTIWNLKKLRHLQLKDKMSKNYHFRFPDDNLDNSSQLCDLDILSCLSLNPRKNINKLLRKFPNIRKLRSSLYLNHGYEYHVAIECLSQLESLDLSCVVYGGDRYQLDIQFPLIIKKLTLSYFRLPWSKMSAIGNLPNLEVLKLLGRSFEGEIWEMEVEKFPKVKFLKLDSLDIVKWTASEYEDQDYFPRLQKLVLESCDALQEIPSCLGNSSTLEIIEVSKCPNCTSSLEEIQEEQRSNGYTDLMILIS